MKFSALFTLIILLTSCLKQESQKNSSNHSYIQKDSITIMTFNVENLFDAEDDPRKNDETYLPLAKKKSSAHQRKCQKIKRKGWRNQCLHWDWNDRVVDIKMKRIAKVIKAFDQGRGPDLVALQEIENIYVLEEMNKKYLNSRYTHVLLLEGHDSRGIDNAILSRLPMIGKPRLTPIRFSKVTPSGWKTDSRGILEATFSLGNEKITFLANHFPAPFHNKSSRQDGFLMLKDFADKNEHLTIAAGDFNLTSEENSSHHILKRFVTPTWKVSHLESCKDCKGTAYYSRARAWSYLDMILVSKKGLKNSKWEIDKNSITVFHPMDFQNKKGKPRRFSMPEAEGLSDHWPVVMTLKKGSRSSSTTRTKK